TQAANPALAAAQRNSPVIVYSDPAQCSVQFDPTNSNHFDTRACDIAKAFLTRAGVSYNNVHAPRGAPVNVHVGANVVTSPNVAAMSAAQRVGAISTFQRQMRTTLDDAGYP